MKILIFFILSLACISAYSQSTLPLRADTVVVEKVGGSAEFKLKNSTRDSIGGILYNIGQGRTAFKKTRKITDTSAVIGGDTLSFSGIGKNLATSTLTANADYIHNWSHFIFRIDSIGGQFNMRGIAPDLALNRPNRFRIFWNADFETTGASISHSLRKSNDALDSIYTHMDLGRNTTLESTTFDTSAGFTARRQYGANSVSMYVGSTSQQNRILITDRYMRVQGGNLDSLMMKLPKIAAADSVVVGWKYNPATGTNQIAMAPASAVGGLYTSGDGIRKNGNSFELGDISTTTTSTFSADRFLRSGNRSIYLQGDKTDNGNPNFVFDDTLAAAPGDPRFKNWMRINSLDHVTPGFHLGTASVDDGTGTSRNNHVMNWGFNLGPNSTRVNPNYCAIGISWEGAFQGLQEMHKFWVDKSNIQHRIESYTIDTAAKSVDLFHQLSAWELKDVDAGAETWVDFTGGQGQNTTNFRMYAGATNQYRLQQGFSVNGGNTTASLSTTGPGNTELHLGVPEGWGMVELPGLTSHSTYNSVSQQLLPSSDGGLIFGDPTARWQKINGLYLRASNGLFIGDYSGDELPMGLIDFGTNRSLVSYASGAANDAVMFVNNGLGASFGIRNLNSAGYSGVEYIGDDGNVKVFTGFNNGNGQEFRFNNVSSGGYIRFLAGGAERFKINNTGGPTINNAYTLPGSDGAIGQVLTSNADGTASWTDRPVTYRMQRATDANVTLTTGTDIVILPSITANRTINFPGTPIDGRTYTVINTNTSGNTWQIGGGTVVDQAGTTVTSFVNNKTYTLVGDSVANVWRIIYSN